MHDRRDFLKAVLAAGALAPAMSPPTALAADVNLRVFYWGSPERVRRTNATSELFAKAHPGSSANAEVSSDYWAKLNIMMAGANLPDVVQLEPNTLPDYARRGALLPLDQFITKGTIKSTEWVRNALELTTVDKKVMGIAQSLNSFAMIYDRKAYAKAGIPLPAFGLTWDEFGRQAVEIAKASGKTRYWGAPYGARHNNVFQAWLMQRGKLLFTEERKVGFGMDDCQEFYAYWENLRKIGACTPGDLSTRNAINVDSSEMASRNCASALLFSNQLVAFHAILPDLELGIAPFPIIRKGGGSGLFYRPGLVWSISKDCRQVDAAARYIDFFVNDVAAGKVLGLERGIPPNLVVRGQIAAQLDAYEKMMVDYINAIEPVVSPYPPAAPAGAVELDVGVMRPIGDELAFGKITVAQAAKRLLDGTKRAIRQT